MKIYLSKLWRGIAALVFFAIMSYLLTDVLITAVNVVIPVSLPWLRRICYLAVPTLIAVAVTYIRRQNNGEMRRAYQTDLGDASFQWFPEIKKILKSPDFIAELAAFVTLLFPFIIVVGIWVNPIASVIFYLAAFVLIDLSIWLFLHYKWAKERLHLPGNADHK